MHNTKKDNIKLKIIIGFGSASILVIIALFIAYLSFKDLMSSIDFLAQPDHKISKLNTLLADVVGTENSMRAYVLSKDKKYLTEYNRYYKSVVMILDSLEEITPNHAPHDSKLKTVRKLWQEKKRDLNQLVELNNRKARTNLSSNTFNDLSLLPKDSAQKKIITNTTKTTTITPLKVESEKKIKKEKEGFLSSLKNIFHKKTPEIPRKEPVPTQIISETRITSDTNIISSSKSDSSIQRLLKKLARLKRQEMAIAEKASQSELQLLDKNKLILNYITNIIIELRREELVASSQNVLKAKAVADRSTEIIVALAILGIISTIFFVSLIFQDITKSNFYKLQLIESKKEAEKLAKAKEDFLANMSHEIRTPLNTIMGFSEQLQSSNLNNKQQYFLEAVTNSSEHLLSIVNDILDFSKLESGKLRFEKIPFSIEQVVQDVCHSLSLNAEEKGVSLSFEFDTKISHLLVGDTLRLKQILFNLISNAIKFTEIGSVTVACFSEYLPGYKTAQVRLDIIDTGIGISENNIEKIFDGFTQADETTTRKYGGTGLGLTICKKLVELQNGILQVKSIPNQGSTFTVELNYPVCMATETDKVEEKRCFQKDLLQYKKILIVEDDELNSLLLHTILKKYKAEVVVAHDGEDGLIKFQNAPFDLVLTDMHMPQLNGIDFVKAIRSLPQKEKSATPVVLITANVLKEQLDQYLEEGVSNYILKPFKEEDLMSKIESVLHLHHTREKALPEITTIIEENCQYSLDDFYKFSHNDPKALQSLLIVLVSNTKKDMYDMQQCILNDNWNQVAEIAHKMISTFSHLKVRSITHNLKLLQNLIKNEADVSQIKNVSKQIMEEGLDVLSKISEEIDDLVLEEKIK